MTDSLLFFVRENYKVLYEPKGYTIHKKKRKERMKVINLTPHDVHICDEYGYVTKTYEASGMVARVRTSFYNIDDSVDGVPMVARVENGLVDLPGPQADVMYIVSNIVLDYCPNRMDLIAPAQQVKVNGRVVGCRAFASNR